MLTFKDVPLHMKNRKDDLSISPVAIFVRPSGRDVFRCIKLHVKLSVVFREQAQKGNHTPLGEI